MYYILRIRYEFWNAISINQRWILDRCTLQIAVCQSLRNNNILVPILLGCIYQSSMLFASDYTTTIDAMSSCSWRTNDNTAFSIQNSTLESFFFSHTLSFPFQITSCQSKKPAAAAAATPSLISRNWPRSCQMPTTTFYSIRLWRQSRYIERTLAAQIAMTQPK